MSLLNHIERYLKRTGVKPTVFGRRVMNDPAFVRQLRNGREPGPKTERRVLAAIRDAERDGKAGPCAR